MKNVTPMMRQYLEIKEKNPDCILFFRLGDFYEMFFDDALTASRELEITLTGRDCGLEERAPMCGVPFHAAENYLSRLVEKGYKVALCEQVEDAALAKGLVKRDVIRIVTPGTITASGALVQEKNNYIASIVLQGDTYGLSIADISTGDLKVTSIRDTSRVDSDKEARGYVKLLDEISKYQPRECILNDESYEVKALREALSKRFEASLNKMPVHYTDKDLALSVLKNHFQTLSLGGLGLKEESIEAMAVASLLAYLRDTQKNDLLHLKRVEIYPIEDYMILDASTRLNLELTQTLREKKRKGSLLWVLDETKTAMGSRYLRNALEQPLVHKAHIEGRLDATQELKENLLLKEELAENLSKMYDIERLVGKISLGSANARDLLSLKASIEKLPQIKDLLKAVKCNQLQNVYEKIDPLTDMYELLDKALLEEAPISLKEGDLIKEGYHEEVDHLRLIKKKGTDWLRDIEVSEREKTGIKNLKIKYNKVFGYFLEVTNSYKNLVPDYFIRKQTLSNAERYITEELKKIEEDVLGADDKLNTLEYTLFVQIRDELAVQMDRFLQVAKALAELDMYCSFAEVAHQNQYVRPTLTEDGSLFIEEGRHPVVEKMLGAHQFIANDVFLNQKEQQIHLITGPNMAGKSTFMRQVALITLMAQVGSFVPAKSATLSVVDRIFTRVGASDDLASGQSTFMVEMMEVSNILNHATHQSLLILDEVGRGTSTIDGLSIAWAIIEHIAHQIGAKTLFATHYHELTSLEKKLPTLKNYSVQVKEVGEDILFLHKIIEGGTDHSYGIQVAKLAGVPKVVLQRARELLVSLDQKDQGAVRALIQSNAVQEAPKKQPTKQLEAESIMQLSIADAMAPYGQHAGVIEELKALEIMEMTPMEALQVLYGLQKKLKNKKA